MTMTLPVVADSFTMYLAEIRKFPILTADEERLLAIKFYEEKDLESAHRLITANLRFVVKVASEYRAYGLKMLDLIQEGNIGLMMAVRKFNPHRGIRLISYAVWWIKAYIQNFIVSTWSLLKIGTTQAQKKLFFKLNQAKNAIKNALGSDDLHETALTLDVKESEVVEMEQRMHGEYSLDAAIEGRDGGTLLDSIADERLSQEELLAEHQESVRLQREITQALGMLNEKERYIIERRVTAEDPLTLQEIADHFAISRERVRQIEEGALKKMRSYLAPIVVEAHAA
ncbi:RNA polymerase sigma factor RpoH [Geobacter argillaceus]|uniref:RNA polymerase sigma factor n=1 Tax=Geobacter argillaceus TaxID=345631 RepID=A0A562VJK5_9BACT|nr:RNA polymerase sigma factor RpoH [Geobacter argillaceus]TWJ18070.1 RNA polymerase RpoH-like sigma 32 subunit [Geobacter argillaceus]